MLGLGTTINRGGFVSAAAEPLLLDTYSGAAAAYSLRQLSSSYSGPALQIRRASDNVEVDVSFDTNGVVSLNSPVTNVTEETSGSSQGSTTATNLGEFVADAGYTDVDSLGSADSALVQCWYDQSSNSNDATQTTAAYQPKIYDSVTGVVTENGKPALEFDGSNDGYLLDTTGLDIGSLSSFTVGTMITISNAVMLALSGSTSDKRWYAPFITGGNFNYGYANSSTAITTTQDTNQNLHTMIAGTTLGGVEAWKNGTSAGTTTRTTGIDSGMNGIANFNSSFYANCNVQEVVYYGSDESANRTNIEDNINTFYSIYT